MVLVARDGLGNEWPETAALTLQAALVQVLVTVLPDVTLPFFPRQHLERLSPIPPSPALLAGP
eukprot:6989974-Alexandrium_andersonii.AAC.1